MRRVALVALLALSDWLTPVTLPAGQVLDNGIELPSPWPPRIERLAPAAQTDPTPPHYLQQLPLVIPIDVGRQLFVDEFLIESTTLKRTFHKLQPYGGNPILKPDQPWEFAGTYREFRGPYAMPFSDGVWYDPKNKCFKMWYMGGLLYSTCYATSQDGLRWRKPKLDVVPGSNIVHPGNRDSATVWLDLDDPQPDRRYKMFRFEKTPKRGLAIHFSSDGIHWSQEVRRAGPALDRTTVFYNPFRKVWGFSIKAHYPKANLPGAFQVRRYWEVADLLRSAMWSDETSALLWVNTDRLDPPLLGSNGARAYIYNLDAVAYESLMLGLFAIHQRYADPEKGQPKKNEIFLGFSRDGFHWQRPLREPFVGISETRGDWNWGNVQPVGGGCLVVGDQLYFYYSGRRSLTRTAKSLNLSPRPTAPHCMPTRRWPRSAGRMLICPPCPANQSGSAFICETDHSTRFGSRPTPRVPATVMWPRAARDLWLPPIRSGNNHSRPPPGSTLFQLCSSTQTR